jgi:hypothetical protein
MNRTRTYSDLKVCLSTSIKNKEKLKCYLKKKK